MRPTTWTTFANTPTDERVALVESALPSTPWDRGLREVMVAQECAAYEESMIDLLLADLEHAIPGP